MLESPLPAVGPVLAFIDLAGIAVFALSGALLAAEKRQDVVTFSFFAVVTGVGGGTVRDLLIGAPVFWVHQNATLLICFAAALAVWMAPSRVWKGRSLLWFDAAGLAAYSAYGAAKGLAYGLAPLPAFGMGVVTGCVGGIIRDLLAGEPTVLMRRELYVTVAALSAALLVGLILVGLPAGAAGLIAAVAGFALRAGAILRGWSLPVYRGPAASNGK
jgi:uncharacterized membrane protein YeiH